VLFRYVRIAYVRRTYICIPEGAPRAIVVCKWNGWFPSPWSWCRRNGIYGGSKVLRFEGL